MIKTTLLSLDEFRGILGYNPWHFWGLAGAKAPVTSSCNDVVREYAWQNADAMGRREISEAIAVAEERLARELQFWPAPVWEDIVVPWTQYHDRRSARTMLVQPPWHRQTMRLPKGQLRKFGVRAFALIQAAVAISYSDVDGDGLNDTFTITVATTVTDPNELMVYFKTADRWSNPSVSDPDAMAAFRVWPVEITISGGTATIVGRAWLVGLPVLQEGTSSPVDPSTASNMATHLDVYRLSIDPTGTSTANSQGVFFWDTGPGPNCYCAVSTTSPANSAYDPAAEAYALARVGIHDAENGLIVAGEAAYNSSTGLWVEQGLSQCREPDRVQLRVQWGQALVRSHMEHHLQLMVARLAMAEMGRRICACESANRELHEWQFDISRSGGMNEEQFAVSLNDLDNPFGTRRGHVWVWKEVTRRAVVRGFSA